MAHVVFTEDFDFTPKEDHRITQAYRAGWSGPVRADCAKQAIALGRAKRIKAPARKAAD